jgi:hypothetical protein
MSGVDDADQERRKYKAPYTPHNPIPTISSYREEQKERRQEEGEETRTNREKAQDAYRSWKEGESHDGDTQQVYETDNQDAAGADEDERDEQDLDEDLDEEEAAKKELPDTSEAPDAGQDAKDKRKSMKKRKDGRAEREVTDPVTHLPIKIHDFTNKDLGNTPENLPPPRTDSGLDETEVLDHAKTQGRTHKSMESLFPSPDYDAVGKQVAKLQTTGLTIGLAVVLATMVGILVLEKLFGLGAQLESKVLRRESAGKSIASIFLLLMGTTVGAVAIWLVRGWTDKQVREVWDRHVWEAERQQGKQRAKEETPESTQWLCELLSSVWPLINPDLFTR